MPPTPGGSKKKKGYTPSSPKSAKAARASRASKRASATRQEGTESNMSSARVDDDILAAGSDDNGDDREHIDPNVIINPGSGVSESGPNSSQQTESASERPRSVSRNRQPSASEQSAEPPISPSNRNSGQDHGDAGGEPHRSRDQGEGGRPEQRSNMPAGDGMRDNGGQGSTPADKEAETRERAIMTALLLIEEALDISQISSSIQLAGQSKLDVKRLLDNIKGCIVDIMTLKIPDDDEILPRLRTARKTLQTMLMQSDALEATATSRAGETGMGTAPTSPSQPSSSPESARELGSGLRYTLAMKQLDCEIVRLKSPRLIDVEQGADVKPDILKDLLKVDVPDIRKSVDRARDALKTLTLVAGAADVEKILEAQDACEKAIDWIALVENRCKAEQLHLDVKQQAREVDFVPFRPGTGVSIYEFFHKFETWSRGMMSLDQKANILYNRHLDSSITDGNKELEDAKEDYQTMKALLIEKWGVPDIVCDQYLANVNRLTLPTDSKDRAGLLAYTKNAYSSLITLTKLEVDRGQKVPGLEDYYLSNQYLKKLYKTLPEELASKFMFQLQENGESYHLMKGRVYMDRIISLLRCSYKGLEIALEEIPKSVVSQKTKPPKLVSVNAVLPSNGYTSSSSSDGQGGQTLQVRQKKKKKTKSTPSPAQTLPSKLGTGTGSSVNTSQVTSSMTSQAQPTQTQPSTQAQPTGATAKPPRPVYQFAPNARSTPMTLAPKPRGPRWACPVNGHTGHTIEQCQDFWGAASCTDRRKLMTGSGCFTCLGRDQGCGNGVCAIINEVPGDTICQECSKSTKSSRVPPSILCCGLKFHRKPLVGEVMEAFENWIPGFHAATLGVPISINWMQVNYSVVSHRPNDWCNDSNEDYLVYNTQTGSTRKVHSADRIVVTSKECACYIMQQLNIAGERVLTFYDSGANNNIVEARLAYDADFLQIGRNSVSFNVAGGGSLRSDHGQFSAILGPDVNGDFHDLECQAVDRITSDFPTFKAKELIAEAKSVIGNTHVFPLEIGGGAVRLLIGIRSTQLAPVLKFTLPSGLCLYESKFRDVYGATLCFGGPHEVFSQGYQNAGFHTSTGMVQVLFTEMASAYLNMPRTFVGGCAKSPAAEGVSFEDVEIFEDTIVVRRHEPSTLEVAQDPVADSSITTDDMEVLRCYHFDKCADSAACYKALIPLSKLKGLVDQNDVPDVTDFRCDVCANCPVCKKSAREKTRSLQEEFEQSIIEKSVHLDVVDNQVKVELPFIREPVEFLSKKHNGNSNRYQALRVYKSQCRKPEEVKEKLRSTVKDLIGRGFMKKLSDMEAPRRKVVEDAKFHHYFPWRAVYKEGSVSTPVRIVVDPSSSGLNETLAKGENMLTRIPEVLISFRSHQHAWCSDISKMYNMLRLTDQALPYSLFLYHESLSDVKEPDVYCMQSAWYGVSSSGNQANVAVDRLWQEFGTEYPAAVGPLSSDRYMDDIDSGGSSRDETNEQVRQVELCLGRGGFKPKFVAHSGEPPPETASSDGRTVSVLGSVWDTAADHLSLGHKPMNLEKKVRGAKAPPRVDVTNPEGLRKAMADNLVTRTTLASRVAEFYDPVGLFEPLKLALKLALSELNALDWLDPIPQDRHEVWIRLLTAMEDSRMLQLDRCIKPERTSDDARLICLSDAAELAGGCAIYVGYPMTDGSHSCRLAYAKSRLMKNTIPRNELEAILLAAEASLVVQRALKGKVSEVFYFSDSTIAISWVLNTSKRLRMWTFNRVKEILTALRWVVGSEDTHPLYHIPGHMNLADMVTRPIEPEEIDMGNESAWQRGIQWMSAPSHNLPKDQPSVPQSREEVEVFEKETFPDQILTVCEDEERQMLLSSEPRLELTGSHAIIAPQLGNTWLTKTVDFVRLGWKRAIGTVKAVLRFVEILRHRVHVRKRENRDNCTGCMTDPEQGIEPLALQLIMRNASQQAMTAEGKRKLDMEYHRDGDTWYSARRLEKEGEPELKDVDGLPFFDALSIKKVLPIVHVQSSIFQSFLSYVHDRLLDHPGVEQTLKGIREVMMPMGGNVRAKIAAYRRACTKCRRRLKDRIQKEVGDFPRVRSTVAPPFYHTMLDIATGFRGKATKNAREYMPVSALVLVCMTTSATSILVLESLSTAAVVQALERHAARYGMPGELFVDSGTQLINLQNAEFDIRGVNGVQVRGMAFKVTIASPKAHHEQGRVERRIRVLRDMLQRLSDTEDICRTVLDWETVFARIASQVDDLPIARGSATAATDLGWEIITPNRLKLGRNAYRSLEGPVVLDNNPASQLERNRLIFSQWYKIFLERLPLLIPGVEKGEGRPIRVGDLVLFVFQDSNIPGMETWKIARVVSLVSSRTILLEYANAGGGVKKLQRSVRQVSLILGVDELSTKPGPSNL